MPARHREISPQAFKDLVEFVAANGTSYARYVRYAEQNNLGYIYTEGYWRQWVKRRKGRLEEARARHEKEVRERTVLAKEDRVKKLEAAVARLEGLLASDELSITDQVKVEEQLRKNLESIAKEKGEYGTKGEVRQTSGVDQALQKAIAALAQPKQLSAPNPDDIVEADYTVVVERPEVASSTA